VTKYPIFLNVVPNTECKARRRWRNNKSNGFFKPAARTFLCREGFALQKSRKCRADLLLEQTNGSAILGTAAVLPLLGSRADAAFLIYHRRGGTVMALMSVLGAG
jgi:hypothetical protein